MEFGFVSSTLVVVLVLGAGLSLVTVVIVLFFVVLLTAVSSWSVFVTVLSSAAC